MSVLIAPQAASPAIVRTPHAPRPSRSIALPQPRRGRLAVKSLLDRATAAALLVPALPVIIVSAAAVKLTSPGPIFYTQVRSGLNGKPFRMIKVRSMRHNCEASTGAVWASRVDHRITFVGGLLRDTHLDELPQLFNVLRGDMSLIGPRPERPEIVEQLERRLPAYRGRLAVRPGLTGLAQVELPADSDISDVQHKLMYDLYYVRHVGLWLDFCIFAGTALHILGLALTTIGRLFVRPCRKSVNREWTDPQLPWTPAGAVDTDDPFPGENIDLPPGKNNRFFATDTPRSGHKADQAMAASGPGDLRREPSCAANTALVS